MLIFSMAVVSPFVISFFLKDLYHCWSLQPPLFFISLYTLYTALPQPSLLASGAVAAAAGRGGFVCPNIVKPPWSGPWHGSPKSIAGGHEHPAIGLPATAGPCISRPAARRGAAAARSESGQRRIHHSSGRIAVGLAGTV